MLFTPVVIGNITLKNRIVMPPMCMYSADKKGFPQPFHQVHYGTRAQGGTGLIIMEATAVEARGRISENDLGIWDDSHIDRLKSIVDLIHSFGAKVCLQLAHAGRKSGVGVGISSSDLRFSEDYSHPHKMTKDDIDVVIHAFNDAARRANHAGFDMVEIHGAHGYLINQFLSPVVNKREDLYSVPHNLGTTFLQEIIIAVKSQFSRAIGLRISGEEYETHGLHPDDHVKIISLLQANASTHIDFLDVSSGGVTATGFPHSISQGYQTEFAAVIKQNTDLPIITGGLLSDYDYCQNIIVDGKADLVWLGRELLRNPYWSLKAADYFKKDIKKPGQYRRAEPYQK